MSQPKNPYTGNPKSHPVSKFSDGMTGTCLCGSISVTIHDSELFTKKRGHLCHCANCRKVAGSFVSSNLIIEEEKVELKDRDGTLKTYMDHATGSGLPVARSFCSVDGKYDFSLSCTFSCKGIVLKQNAAQSSRKQRIFQGR